MRAKASHYGIVLFLLLASWPSVRWYGARMLDGSDEPWGVLALATGFGFSFLGVRQCFAFWRYLVAAMLMLLPLVSGVFMTPLIQSLFVALSLASLLVDRRCWVGHVGLFVLALPLISSLQFYGGFPLRWVIGKASSALLGVLGFGVEAQGTMLHWRGEVVAIDAPCSGVQMLWSSVFLACLMICIHKPNFRGSLLVLQVAGVSAFLGNVLRNVLLFFLESGVWNIGKWGHDPIGLIVFAMVLAAIVWVGGRVKGGAAPSKSILVRTSLDRVGPPTCLVLVLGCVGFSNIESARRLPEGTIASADILDSIQEDLYREGWYEIPLEPRAVEYAKGFPGKIELYGRDERRLAVRVIDRATRRYHLSADCYRAIGYDTEPMPIFMAVDGSLWGRVMATRDGECLEVRERVVSQDGQAWTDPSSWFWSAMMGRSEGPWVGYAETVPVKRGAF
ncbi:archaeosortase/exosortase family protein [Pelagicoccus sp. SDUM812002]|uniref:archaeosortase/exosortase family protein n=1 Tax=Pelagicoccus sp. SDUM812002 TaxID=3041266 RepID=UPI00280DC381|nr:archaeosortase/exosortase family protein [Pelagicoccus sp. SDUM812002]MDQ8186574.1 archaeosortase/exosortase family protein [Pelagicoccus sp. SDUM812002]